MLELTFDDCLAWVSTATVERYVEQVLMPVIDGEQSRLCPGVPRRAVWAAVRLSMIGRHGMIEAGTELALVAALGMYEFQPDFLRNN